jgi:hypothetical protein
MSQLLVDHNLLTETDYQQGNRGCEENVDERTHRKAGNQPQNPQNDQYDRYRPQHVTLLSDCSYRLPADTQTSAVNEPAVYLVLNSDYSL